MDDRTWMWIIGIIVALFQVIQSLQFKSMGDKFMEMKDEMKELWERANKHGHDLECNQGDCKITTKRVTIGALIFFVMTSLSYAADFNPVWENTILPHEGGYSNNIHDPGNWTGGVEGRGRFLGTKYGIAASVYGESLLKKGIIIKQLTKDQAKEIFKRDYWDANNFGYLKSQHIAEELCDEAVNTGKVQTERLLDRTFKEIEWAQMSPISVPPKFTVATMLWINEYTADRRNRISFYNSIRMKRVKFYTDLVIKKPKYKPFFLAWIDRSCD